MLANGADARVGYLSFAARLPLLYMAERRDRYLLNAALFAAFKGLSRDRLEALGEEYCERILIAHLFPQATAMIEANRTAGLEPILVTGSPDFIIAPLAAHLNIATFVANRLVYSRGRATGRLHEPIMAGDAKAAWCAEICRGTARRSSPMLGLCGFLSRPGVSLPRWAIRWP